MIKRFLNYTSKYKFKIFIIIVFAIVVSVTSLMSPLLVGKAIDNIIDKGNVNFNVLSNLIVKLLILYFLTSIANFVVTAMSSSMTNKVIKDIRNDGFDKITKLPISYFDKNEIGQLMSYFTNDLENISEGLLQFITSVFVSIITLVGALILMIYIDFLIGIVVVIVAPITVFIARFVSKNSSDLFTETQQIIGEYSQNIEESFRNLKVVKAFGYEENIYESSATINNKLYTAGQKSQFYSSLANPTSRFVNHLAYISVGLISGISAIGLKLTVGNISSLLALSSQFTKPINELTGILTQLQQASASAKRFFDFLDEVEEDNDDNSLDIKNVKGNFFFDKVSFSYDTSNKIFDNFNVEIEQGTSVAIVGKTGAGKTTLVNLLLRFYEINKGAILIDSVNAKNIKRDSLRKAFTMVLQETWLYSASAKENIAFGKKDATLDEVVISAKSAHAHNFISRLPQGYDTIIGESGINLSTGEKQLLTIARAMLVDAPILILDEATSNVDPRTELEIQKALTTLKEGKTSFIIAHRLSTIKDVDMILVMDKGKIIEKGNFDYLMKLEGEFHDLYNSQFKGND